MTQQLPKLTAKIKAGVKLWEKENDELWLNGRSAAQAQATRAPWHRPACSRLRAAGRRVIAGVLHAPARGRRRFLEMMEEEEKEHKASIAARKEQKQVRIHARAASAPPLNRSLPPCICWPRCSRCVHGLSPCQRGDRQPGPPASASARRPSNAPGRAQAAKKKEKEAELKYGTMGARRLTMNKSDKVQRLFVHPFVQRVAANV